MAIFFDSTINAIQTGAALAQRGLSLDVDFLRGIGILPIDYPEPAYNPDTHALEADGEPQPNAAGTAYVQAFAVVELPMAEARAAVKARATATRWRVETGGIDEPGFGRICTGLDDQNRVASALVGINAASAAGQPIASVDFKGADGWAYITADQLGAIAVIISIHVQACFSREKALHEAIDATTSVAELAAIDISAGWPAGATQSTP